MRHHIPSCDINLICLVKRSRPDIQLGLWQCKRSRQVWPEESDPDHEIHLIHYGTPLNTWYLRHKTIHMVHWRHIWGTLWCDDSPCNDGPRVEEGSNLIFIYQFMVGTILPFRNSESLRNIFYRADKCVHGSHSIVIISSMLYFHATG